MNRIADDIRLIDESAALETRPHACEPRFACFTHTARCATCWPFCAVIISATSRRWQVV